MAINLGLIASQITGHLNNNSFESISTVTLNSTTSSITFSSFPSTYKHLQIRGVSAGDQNVAVRLRFNGDTASNYVYHGLQAGPGYGASVYTNYGTNQTSGIAFDQQLGNSTYFNASITDILDYNDTNKNKTVKTFSGVNSATDGFVYLQSSLWKSGSAITSITLYPFTGSGFVSATQFALYGIKG